MKKWFQWQFDNQCKSQDWDKWTKPIANVKQELDWFFKQVKDDVKYNKLSHKFENTFHRTDWTEKTAAGAGIDPTELWQWVREYPKLMYEAGIIKIHDFDQDTKSRVTSVLSQALRLQPDTINFYCHNEAPGQTFPMHFDRHKWNKFSTAQGSNYDPNYGLFLIFFDDWQHGQAFQQGKKFLTWRSGDVFTWDHESTPHGSANFGFEDRYTLLVNGVHL
jgi:hypothetical protein